MKNTKIDRKFRVDFNIVESVILLSVFGTIMLYSSSAGDNALLKEQLIFMAGGLVGMLILQFIDYRKLKGLAPYCYGLAVLAILLLLTPLKVESHGATRWIDLKLFTIQISEVVKILMIVYLAHVLSKNLLAMTNVFGILRIWISVGIIGAMLLIISKNLSSCLILLMVTFCLTFIVSNLKNMHFLTLIGVLVLIGLACWFLLNHLPTEEELNAMEGVPHQLKRIFAWLAPDEFADDSFQTKQGLYALGSGGLFGKGLGQSRQRRILPEASNDMIFCILIEELGIFGGVMLLILYCYFFYQILLVTISAKTVFGRLLCASSLLFFACQTLVNIAVVTAIIPNTGVTLPFISKGGSALLIAYAQVALVLSVYRHDVLNINERR